MNFTAPNVRPNANATRSTASIAVALGAGHAASGYASIVPTCAPATHHFAQSMFKYATTVEVVYVTTVLSPVILVLKNYVRNNVHASVISAKETCVVPVLTNSAIHLKTMPSGYVASATRVFTLARDSMWSTSSVAVM
jgi:hypothetical protein